MRNKKVITASLIIGLAVPVSTIAPARAETFVFSSSPLTNLDPAGTTVNGGFTKFPTKSGMYLAQCVEPVGSARPVTCNDATQLWITPAGGTGTTSPTGAIAMKVVGSITGKGVTVDCTTNQCGLFFRLDHLATNDISEDKFLPITFKAGVAGSVLPADAVVVTLNGKMLTPNVPSNLGYRAAATIVATTKSGLPVTLSSLTPECTVVDNQLTALKGSGQCALAFKTAGSTSYAPAAGNFPFLLVPGDQRVSASFTSLKKSTSKKLPSLTNFGEEVTYKSKSKNCIVKANVVSAKNMGSCVITATAPEKTNMWNALATNITISVK